MAEVEKMRGKRCHKPGRCHPWCGSDRGEAVDRRFEDRETRREIADEIGGLDECVAFGALIPTRGGV